MASDHAAEFETAFCYAGVEAASPGESPQRLRGWIVPKPGQHFTDVRVWSGSQLFPAVHGYPRPDLAARFPFAPTPLLVGFLAEVPLRVGTNTLQVEALGISGEWQSVLSVTVTSLSNTAGTPPSESLQPHEFVRALDSLLRRLGSLPERPLEAVAAEIAAAISFRRQLLSPPPGFHAHWDEPGALTPAHHGRLALGGFIFHEPGLLRRLLATTDLLLWQTVETGRARPDVAQHFPQFPHAATSGAFALIDAPAQLPSPLTVRIYAELADGSLHLCGAQRTRIVTPAESRRRYPARGTVDLNRARPALEDALRTKGLSWQESAGLSSDIEQLAIHFAKDNPANAAPARFAPLAPAHLVPHAVTLCTHNLNLEGAPLFLLDLARTLAGGGAKLTVLSPADGPMRERFEALGARVLVLDLSSLLQSSLEAAARTALTSFSAEPAFAQADLVIANTFASFWGVHAAKLARKPALFYVHESVPPAHFYRGQLSPPLVALVEEAFRLADGVSFTTAATRACHLGYGRNDNQWITSGWIDVAALDAWRTANSRADCRRRLGVNKSELLVSNIGTVSDRKGQHVFVRAVELLWRQHPELAARARFVMLGGRSTIFDRQLADLLSHCPRKNLAVAPETADYLPYFYAADLFVCSSFEESSPRVVLEAMALGAPILSSDVNGVPEQVRHAIDAELVPPGDTAALASAMAHLLSSPETARTRAAAARARVVAEFNAATLLPRHVALACAVAAGQL